MRSPLARVALTILLPILLVLASDRMLLPGMDELLAGASRSGGEFFALGRSNVSVFALGIMPAITAYGIVELSAFLVKRWSHLRHGNPEGRAKLDRAARIVTIVLAAFQAWSVAQTIAGLDSLSGTGLVSQGLDLPSRPVVVATLLGGVCVQIVVASIISRQGIANGYVLLLVVESIAEQRGSFAAQLQKVQFLGTLEAKHVVLLVLVVGLPAVATWMVLRGGADRETVHDTTITDPPAASPYRSARAFAAAPWVPVPSSSIAPYAIAISLVTMPVLLLGAFGFRRAANDMNLILDGRGVYTTLLVVVTGAVAVVLARVLHQPREMADVARRVGFASGAEATASAHAALRATIVPTVLFFAVFLFASNACAMLPLRLSVTFVPLLVAVVMDFGASLRATTLVAVWQERRASAVPVVRAVLEAEGIDVTVRGLAVLSLLQSFGAYAPAELLVGEADRERATAVLRHVFLGEKRPDAEPVAENPRKRHGIAWTPSRRNVALGIATVASMAVLGLASMRTTSSDGPVAQRHRLEIVRVDDEDDFFGRIADADVPAEVEIRFENAPAGPGRAVKVSFARTAMREGESYEAAFRRIRKWCDSLKLPPDHRIGLEPVEDYDEDTGKSQRVGVRTFLLVGPPVITTDDVIDAAASMNTTSGIPEVYVAITLSEGGGERFRVVTRDNVQKRIAIIVDDEINSAPVVKAEISGGRVSITMGAGDPDRQVVTAKALAKSLSPH